MFDRIGRIPELAGAVQQCIPAHARFATAASRVLIDDRAPGHYDPLRIVRKNSLGMSVSGLRSFISCIMVLLLPLSLVAADAGSAILHSEGGVWLNGTEISGSTAVFPGDAVETKPGFVANIDAEGSSVLIQPESIVKFEGSFLNLEHGSVSVGTSTLMSVHVNCIKVDPITNERTQYDVTNVNSTVQVVAHKNDVKIEEGSSLRKTSSRSALAQSATVHEGEQAKRDETQACGAGRPPESPANGLNQKWLEIGGGAVAGVVALCLLLCTSKGKSSVSPSQP
jgi:hypothetical protein